MVMDKPDTAVLKYLPAIIVGVFFAGLATEGLVRGKIRTCAFIPFWIYRDKSPSFFLLHVVGYYVFSIVWFFLSLKAL